MPEKDSELTLPQFCVLKASAGSGKTHTLTKRYVQLLLSSVLPQNSLKNVLAITFSNNAALEMKERVIAWLKDLYREEPSKTAEIQQIVSCGPAELKARAEMLLETIFDNYSDFQIKTIDSFMAAIFKASALEFGYPPDFEILLNSSQVMAYAFDLFLRGAREGSKEGELLDGAVSFINAHKGRDSAFNWNPSRPLLEEIIKINRKGVVPSAGSFRQVEVELQPLKVEIKALVTEIQGFLVTSGLERTKRDPLGKVFECLTEGRFLDLLGIGMKQRPVKKPSSKNNDLLEKHTLVLDKWATLNSLVSRLAILYSRLYYFPYLKTLNSFSPFLENIKRREGKIFIEDVTLKLSEFISQSIVPDIYFKIGETVYHYLMDEFQDTSPLQWNNLLPLIQNPISQGGTLFAVGDTKQAIYLFRDADYRIMKGFETTNPFPSAAHLVRELGTNYRSLPSITKFNELLFQEIIKKSRYGNSAALSGLTSFSQTPLSGLDHSGYVEVSLYDKEPEMASEKEKVKILLEELVSRGFAYSDIAVLPQKNDEVAIVSAWLDEFGVPFISHSSLDIRKRRVIRELLALLRFLNSPVDDYSFSVFCLGKIMRRALSGSGEANLNTFLFSKRDETPKYKAFQKKYENLWRRYFEKLFKVAGHFPPYDLVSEVFRIFDLFTLFPEEEAALVKLLELVKDFEDSGTNSLIDFLKTASLRESEELDWNVSLPMDLNAIQVMTVHKSKGLGFPVVIHLLYGEGNKGFDYIQEEGEEGTYLLKITGKIAEKNSRLDELYQKEKERDLVSRMNRLYVALTRAKSELYILAVKGRKDSFPFDVLSEAPETLGVKQDYSGDAGKTLLPKAKVLYSVVSGFSATPPKGRGINISEMERGEIFHKVLCEISVIDGSLEDRLKSAISGTVPDQENTSFAKEIQERLMMFIMSGEIRPYFEEKRDREIENEKEFANSKGDLLRMDRVVIDPGRVTVIDFKTGTENVSSEKYVLQVKQYMEVLSEIFPERKIAGLLANIDTLSSTCVQ